MHKIFSSIHIHRCERERERGSVYAYIAHCFVRNCSWKVSYKWTFFADASFWWSDSSNRFVCLSLCNFYDVLVYAFDVLENIVLLMMKMLSKLFYYSIYSNFIRDLRRRRSETQHFIAFTNLFKREIEKQQVVLLSTFKWFNILVQHSDLMMDIIL